MIILYSRSKSTSPSQNLWEVIPSEGCLLTVKWSRTNIVAIHLCQLCARLRHFSRGWHLRRLGGRVNISKYEEGKVATFGKIAGDFSTLRRNGEHYTISFWTHRQKCLGIYHVVGIVTFCRLVSAYCHLCTKCASLYWDN